MTEQDLDDPDASATLQKVGGKAMPKRVGRHTLADLGHAAPAARQAGSKSAEASMIAGLLARSKQPRSPAAPASTKGAEDLSGGAAGDSIT